MIENLKLFGLNFSSSVKYTSFNVLPTLFGLFVLLGFLNFSNQEQVPASLVFSESIQAGLYICLAMSILYGLFGILDKAFELKNNPVVVFVCNSYNKINFIIDTRIWGIFAEPPRILSTLFKILPFVFLVTSYVTYSNHQTSMDKKQKVYPTVQKMMKKTEKNLLTPNKRISAENLNALNAPIEAENKIIEQHNKDNPDSPLVKKELIKGSAYDKWKPINKKIKNLEKEIKKAEQENIPTFDLKLERWSLKLDAYKLGITNSIMWKDTTSSLYRLLTAMLIASVFSLIVALYMGMYKLVEFTLNDFTTVYSLIQPVAILPIIMIIFGVEDYGKMVFIVLGTVPPLLLATYLNVKAVPMQTIIKGKTLGASDFQVIRTIVLPQVMPHFINTVRLTLFLGWMLLLTSEMISAESGLGYRIMLEKRFTNMDTIIPYVLWIMSMSYLTDKTLQMCTKTFFPWHKTR